MDLNLLTAEEATLLHDKIANAQHIVIVGHSRPDGDAIGSCLAWATYLSEEFGKEAAVVVPNAFPDFLHWLPGRETIVRYDKHPEEVKRLFAESDLVFCCDFNLYSRVDDMEEVLKNAKGEFVMIDHHLGYDIDTVVRASFPDLSSTCEIVFRIVWQMGGFDKLSKKFAICDYCGMMTDTGGFTFASTRPEIFFIICQLLTKGIDKDKIYRNVFNNYSSWAIRLRGYLMAQKLNVFDDLHASYYTLMREDMKNFHYMRGDAEGLVNVPLQIKGMKCSVSLREDDRIDNRIWVSLRSVDDFSVEDMAKRFYNGGGHFNASGGKLDCTMDEAVAITKKAFEYYAGKLKG
jgi:phosphoesterase RecJ-like protein